MKAILTATVLVSIAGSVSAAGVNVNHCLKPGVKMVNECLKDALKKVEPKQTQVLKAQPTVQTPKVQEKKAVPKAPTKKAAPKQSFAITDKDITDGAKPLPYIEAKDVRCLAYSIFREAGNQKEKDQYAVGQVHINRLREGSWGKSMCKVVFAKAQFSWTLESKLDSWSKRQEEHFMQIAEGLMIDGFHVKKLASNKILHYHATYVNPKWAKQGKMVASAGDHVFYKNVPY
jgi:spore germination cell wall hydrolase CwlJ-like protein